MPEHHRRARTAIWLWAFLAACCFAAGIWWYGGRRPDLMSRATRVPGFTAAQNETFSDYEWTSPTTALLSGPQDWILDTRHGSRTRSKLPLLNPWPHSKDGAWTA